MGKAAAAIMSEDAVMNMAIDQVFQEVRNERLHQDLEWGGPGQDDGQPMGQFLEYIEPMATG